MLQFGGLGPLEPSLVVLCGLVVWCLATLGQFGGFGPFRPGLPQFGGFGPFRWSNYFVQPFGPFCLLQAVLWTIWVAWGQLGPLWAF